eukprot:2315208-Amphidinium_carterae.1
MQHALHVVPLQSLSTVPCLDADETCLKRDRIDKADRTAEYEAMRLNRRSANSWSKEKMIQYHEASTTWMSARSGT